MSRREFGIHGLGALLGLLLPRPRRDRRTVPVCRDRRGGGYPQDCQAPQRRKGAR